MLPEAVSWNGIFHQWKPRRFTDDQGNQRSADIFVTLVEQSRPLSSTDAAFRSLVSLRVLEILFHRPARPSNDKRFMVSARDPTAPRHSSLQHHCWPSSPPPSSRRHGMIHHCCPERLGNARGYFAKIEYLHFPDVYRRGIALQSRQRRMANQKGRKSKMRRPLYNPSRYWSYLRHKFSNEMSKQASNNSFNYLYVAHIIYTEILLAYKNRIVPLNKIKWTLTFLKAFIFDV